METDPQKAKELDYLLLLVNDWHKDCMLMAQAVEGVVATSGRRPNRLPPQVPDPPTALELSPNPEDYEWCDAYFRTIAYNNYTTTLAVLHVGPDPSRIDLARSLGYGEVMELNATNEWMRLIGGLFKSMLWVYPSKKSPASVPERPGNSPNEDEGQLWKNLKSELEALARDQIQFVNNNWSGKAMEMPRVGKAAAPSRTDCISSIETDAHQIFMDLCRIANHLPDHFPPPGPGQVRVQTK